MPNLCCTQPQAVRTPKSLCEEPLPSDRSTFSIASRALVDQLLAQLVAADLLQLAVAIVESSSGALDILARATSSSSSSSSPSGRFSSMASKHLAFGRSARPRPWQVALPAAKSSPRELLGSSSSRQPPAGPFGERLGAVVLVEEDRRDDGRSACRSCRESSRLQFAAVENLAAGIRRPASAARP